MGCCDDQRTCGGHDELHVGQCPDCGGDVDEDGDTVERDYCSYSPVECETCGWRPCDGSC
jgi:hypothetical protein